LPAAASERVEEAGIVRAIEQLIRPRRVSNH
jgi:hypothetical protein